MKTQSIIIKQGTIKDINGEDNFIPNDIIFTVNSFGDEPSLSFEPINPAWFPRLDIDFPDGLPNGIKILQVEELYHGQFEANRHYRLSFDPDTISDSELEDFIHKELDNLGDPEYSGGASIREVKPFGYIDIYVSILF